MVCQGDKVTNWEFFKQQWQDYELATGLEKKDPRIRLATLRSVMGKDCLQIFMNLKLTADERKDVNMCLQALEEHFKPKRNVVYERYVFNLCTQNDQETTDEFVNRIRKLASSCEFGTLTEELIRDKLVLGIKDQATKLRLLKEEKLTLDRAINMCRSSEIANIQLKSMTLESHKEENVNAIQGRHRKQNKYTPPRGDKAKRPAKEFEKSQHNATKHKCYHCGRQSDHELKDCPAFGQTCRACGKKNHFASACLSSKQNTRDIRAVDESDDVPSDEDPIFHIEEVSSVKDQGRQLFANLNFPNDSHRLGTQLVCQLDTGATCNVISYDDVSRIEQTGNPRLRSSNVKLRLFDGSLMKPLGTKTLKVENNNSKTSVVEDLTFQVIKTQNKPLLSAETCQRLGLIKVNIDQVNNVNTDSLLSRDDILLNYKDVFEGLGHLGNANFVLKENCTPVQHAPRRVPVALHTEVKDKIADMENKGIIKKETDPTDWISSMVVVAKPNKIRICLDPKDLNQALKRPKYQMPTLDELLPKLNNAKVFTTLDAKDGFYQISLDEQSSKLTTFWTPFGRYRYLRMPFGVNTAPEEFECKLQEKLADLPGVEVLRDDMLVIGYGDTQEEAERNHDKNLKALLNRARAVNLKLNAKKMNLRKTEVKFMGHLITKDGLKPDPEKISAIQDMPKPTSKQELMSLLGFVNYLAKFMPKLAHVSKPLRDLTTKNAQFVWSSQHDKAFDEVKLLVTSQPVLKYYDVNEEVTLQCDASEKGLGAALLQNGQPVAFASRTLSPTEQRYAQIEKECLAIIFGCEKFSQYITRRAKVSVESDHKPLQSIFRKSLLEAPCRLQRMMLRLQRYNLDVKYKPGPQMYIADHLSRASVPDGSKPETEFQVFTLELESILPLTTVKISSERLGQLQKATEQDPVMQTLKTTILTGWPSQRDEVPVHIREFWNFRDELTLHNGVLFKNQRIIVPKALRPEVMTRIHSSHLGIESCLRKARDLVFWPSMNSEIKETITNCSVCAEHQAKQQKQPMQSHQLPDRPWSRLSSDMFTLHNKEYVVLVDSYSDFIEVRHLKTTTSNTLIEFYKEQFSRHGIPDVLMTDNGPQYTSREFADFAQEWEFKHLSSSPHHSRSNGKAESAVKIVKNLFKKAIADNKDPWLALLDYRNTPTEGIKTSPCQRLMSRRTRTLVPVSTNLLYPEVVSGVQDSIELKRQKAKCYFDKNAKTLPELDIGQEVRVTDKRRKTWQLGKCLDKLSDRSYLVQANDEVVRRNREDIRPQVNTTNNTQATVAENTDTEDQQASIPQATPQQTPARRTSSRTIKPPARFKDYV